MKTLEQLEKENKDFREQLRESTGLLKEAAVQLRLVVPVLKDCESALGELMCYDSDFYERTCPGLVKRIEDVMYVNDKPGPG